VQEVRNTRVYVIVPSRVMTCEAHLSHALRPVGRPTRHDVGRPLIDEQLFVAAHVGHGNLSNRALSLSVWAPLNK
jgi:hypothetical protein